MHLNTQNKLIDLCAWSDQGSMIAFLHSCSLGYLLFDTVSEQSKAYYAITLLTHSTQDIFGIGCIYGDDGLKPTIIVLSDETAMIVGFERYIMALRLLDNVILFTWKTNSLVYSIIEILAQRLICVVQELGVSCLDYAGREQWSFFKDIVTYVQIDNDYVYLSFLDDEAVRLSVHDGTLL